MPAFNAGIFISEAIESIMGQTFSEWELILVDDGSGDKTVEVVESYCRKDDRVQLIQIEHIGIAEALNVGLQASCAPYIARMDSDDISHPDRLAKQFQFLEGHSDIAVVACLVKLIEREERSEGLEAYVDWANTLLDSKQISEARFVDAPIIHPSAMYRRSLIDQFGAYRDGLFPEDYELWLRWLESGVQMAKIPEILFHWRDHSKKLTRTDQRYCESALWGIKGQYFGKWYADTVESGRELLIWGSGRKTRSRLKYFESCLAQNDIAAFIDISPKKVGTRIEAIPVVSPEQISKFANPFIIGMVGSRGARELIREDLEGRGKVHGIDFIFVA